MPTTLGKFFHLPQSFMLQSSLGQVSNCPWPWPCFVMPWQKSYIECGDYSAGRHASIIPISPFGPFRRWKRLTLGNKVSQLRICTLFPALLFLVVTIRNASRYKLETSWSKYPLYSVPAWAMHNGFIELLQLTYRKNLAIRID